MQKSCLALDDALYRNYNLWLMNNKRSKDRACAVYLRIYAQNLSPAHNDFTILMQLDECLKIARSKGCVAVAEFRDSGDEKNPFHRQGFNQMLSYMVKSNLSGLVISSLDSLSPDYAIYLRVEKILEKIGIKIICPNFIC